jgi:hypothetical protein
MNQIAFVAAAYTVTLGGLAAMLGWCLLAMRRAEAASGEVR